MSPDSFIPLYGNEFFAAVQGCEDHVSLGYLRAIWYYWSHNHCEGLRDDQEFLRKICGIDKHLWEEAMAIIFDNDKFFTMGEDGLWHQKRAKVLWDEASEGYARRVARSKIAAKASAIARRRNNDE